MCMTQMLTTQTEERAYSDDAHGLALRSHPLRTVRHTLPYANAKSPIATYVDNYPFLYAHPAKCHLVLAWRRPCGAPRGVGRRRLQTRTPLWST